MNVIVSYTSRHSLIEGQAVNVQVLDVAQFNELTSNLINDGIEFSVRVIHRIIKAVQP